jgi:hypothetical protein
MGSGQSACTTNEIPRDTDSRLDRTTQCASGGLSAVEVEDDQLAQSLARQKTTPLDKKPLEAFDGRRSGEEIGKELRVWFRSGSWLGSSG